MAIGMEMSSSKGLRLANIVLSILIIAFSAVLIEFPIFTSAVLVVLAAFALLFSGLARIIQGISEKSSGSSRAFLIGVG